MKKHLLFLLLAGITLPVLAQYNHSLDEGFECSHAKSLYYHVKGTQDIIQTPLLHDYDVTFYWLDLNVENNTIDISGNVTIQADVVVNELDTFAFELLDELTVDSVLINGIIQSHYNLNDEVFVPLQQPLAMGNQVSAQIFYHGTPPTGGFFSGISTQTSNQWGKDVTWTLSEPFNARQWWPCKQVLTDKADSSWVFLTTSDGNLAGSNGLLTAITTMPGDKIRFEWKSGYPIDYYLISFAVSEYQEYNIYAKPDAMQGDSILVQNYVYNTPGCLETYKEGIDRTTDFIELFSDLYSLYPFHEEKYGHCLTELGGGMEHQTMTTIGGFGFGLVAHELGHMWFGDNITCATWSDIWINEGFATYSDYLANLYINGNNVAQQWMQNTHDNVMSQPGGSVYVPEDEVTYENVGRIFSGRLSYRKGASIIHMMRFEIGDDTLFFDAMKNFQQQFKDSVATGLDFMNVVNATTGLDFTEFFDQWYFGEGYPTYDISWFQDENGMHFTSTQTTSTSITTLFKMKMEYKLDFSDGSDTVITVYQTSNVNSYTIPVSKTVTGIEVDPENWVLNKVGTISMGGQEIPYPARFFIGPNPVKDEMNIFFGDNITGIRDITLYDISGRPLSDWQTDQESLRVDVSWLKPSVYLITINSAGERFTKRFIKE